MSQVTYRMGGGLSQDQLERMHQTALRVLDEVGLAVADREVLDAVRCRQGVGVTDGRVHLDPALVQLGVDEHRKSATPPRDNEPFTIDILSGYAFQIVDSDSGTLRPMTTGDCIETARIVDGLHGEGVVGGTPGMPQDVPVELREVLSYKIGCEQSRTAGDVGITSLRAAEAIYEMSQVLGKPFGLPIFVLDPLEVAGDSIAMTLTFLRQGRPLGLGVSTMPLLGLTCPIHLPGAFVENIATVLGAYSLLRLMDLGTELRCHFDVYPFDLRCGTVAYGTPEHVLIYLMGAQINRYYGACATTAKPFHTNAIFPDAHSVAQRAAFGMAAALDGARRFTFGGMLGIDKVFSAAQLLIDVEIVDYLDAVVRGFEFDSERLCFDAIREVGPRGSFVTHQTTLDNYHATWTSELFSNLSPEQWEAGDRKRLEDRVRERLRAVVRGHDFELPPDKARELGRIYDHYRASVLDTGSTSGLRK